METKALCLGLLTLGDSTGYEIKKALAEGPLSHFQFASFGTIYPALNQLEARGFVGSTAFTQNGRPDKKVYSITESGRAEFRRILKADPLADRIRSDHVFMLFFGDHMDTDHRREVRDGYLEYYRDAVDRLEKMDLSKALQGPRFAHQMGLTIYRAIIEFLESNRSEWFDEDEPESDTRDARTGT